jgi:hypothetical protein
MAHGISAILLEWLVLVPRSSMGQGAWVGDWLGLAWVVLVAGGKLDLAVGAMMRY